VKVAAAQKVVDTVADEKKAREETAKHEDETAKIAKEKQEIFDKAAKTMGQTEWKADEVLKGVRVWVDSLKVNYPGAEQYEKCGGEGMPKKTCSAGCICLEKNKYYHACEPPPGAGGGCNPGAAKALIDGVKAKNTAVFQAADNAKNAKEAASKTLLDANIEAKQAKMAAANALEAYNEKLKMAKAKENMELEVMAKMVATAQDELKKQTQELKKQEKIRETKIHEILEPEIKIRDKKVKVAEVTGKASEKATKVSEVAQRRFKSAAKRLKNFYAEVKGWQEALK